mmetsp:Transcript_4089/g.9720  ORF Transcript_4089/g.9720 Transcript_4089/m.9720 type:complete len:322 (+) Transcript_4089:706-1671(+)
MPTPRPMPSRPLRRRRRQTRTGARAVRAADRAATGGRAEWTYAARWRSGGRRRRPGPSPTSKAASPTFRRPPRPATAVKVATKPTAAAAGRVRERGRWCGSGPAASQCAPRAFRSGALRNSSGAATGRRWRPRTCKARKTCKTCKACKAAGRQVGEGLTPGCSPPAPGQAPAGRTGRPTTRAQRPRRNMRRMRLRWRRRLRRLGGSGVRQRTRWCRSFSRPHSPASAPPASRPRRPSPSPPTAPCPSTSPTTSFSAPPQARAAPTAVLATSVAAGRTTPRRRTRSSPEWEETCWAPRSALAGPRSLRRRPVAGRRCGRGPP